MTNHLARCDMKGRSIPMSTEVHEELVAWREATAEARQAAWDCLVALCDDDCTDPELDDPEETR